MKILLSNKWLGIVGACLAIAMVPTHAGVIAPISVADLAADGSNIALPGTLVSAWNVEGDENVVINGITFLAQSVSSQTATVGQISFAALGAGGLSYEAINDNAAVEADYTTAAMQSMMGDYGQSYFSSSANARFEITFTGLTIGETYQAQFLSDGNSVQRIYYGDATSTIVSSDYSTGFAGNDAGKIVTFTFTADGESQLFTMKPLPNSFAQKASLSAVSLVAIPEASTTAWMGGSLFMLAFTIVRRRRV